MIAELDARLVDDEELCPVTAVGAGSCPSNLIEAS